MNDIAQENWADQKIKQLYSALNNSLIDINELSNDVIAAVASVRLALKPGFPKSVYQLMLFNNLIKKGCQLETEISMLNHCVKNEPDRELIIVNGMLVIECILDDKLINHYQKRIMFDLQNNGLAMGLLINFNADMQKNRITKVYQNFGIH